MQLKYPTNSRTIWLMMLCISSLNCNSVKKDKVNSNLSMITAPTLKVIYRSTDNGNSWSSFSNGIPDEATLSGIDPYQNKIYVTTDYHGAFVSKNGENRWQPLNNGLPKSMDINCIVALKNNLVIGTFKQGIFISSDLGLHWKKPKNNINGIPIRALFQFKNKIIAGTDNGFHESTDLGNSWNHNFGEMQILGFTSLNEKIYAAVFNGVMMSEDVGMTWKYIYKSDALHDISNDSEYVYAMTLGNGLLKSKNDGVTWENAHSGFGTLNHYTFELKHIDKHLFAGQWNGVFHSDNGGNQWNILYGLPDSTAFSTLEVTDYGLLAGVAIRG